MKGRSDEGRVEPMLFSSKIRGIWREAEFIHIKSEYGSVRFRIQEIKSIQISDWDGNVYPLGALPLRRVCLIFTLKSGRKRTCGVQRITMCRWQWVLELIDIEKYPEIKLPEM